MNKKYEKLFESVQLPNGRVLENRFVMAPMVVEGSSYEGDVQEDDLKYFARRSKSAGTLIAGAANVGPLGNAFGYGLSNKSDDQLEGLTQLATTMKADGATAIAQIFHPGREAKYSYKDEGKVYGPSDANYSFLPYPVTGLTAVQVEEFIGYFKDATRRSIAAGFDGVEIHGANHYLIQQFFSEISNTRTDQWGGSLEKRAAFPKAILKAVKEVVKDSGRIDFIIGYRISPEEIHGDNVGYTADEALYLIEELTNIGLDYIHTAQWGPEAYKTTSKRGQHQGQVINALVKDVIAGKAVLIGAGDVTSPDKALDALNYVDLVAMASAIIVEPDFVEKLKNGHEADINFDVAGRVEDLALPANFYLQAPPLKASGSIPAESIALLETK
ncbi:NADH-dependent flavin oxidoreductase [Fundicoccus culcitae]|uniref:NADH-dependent flavin oxidoreductase n=1 Tax=Fundicoccus culcitae TaxID=2969821 RepID=A0ABY5P3Z6_9LACT|nr:NADH-dependent flavin oxidoreductase [Fundicoccus culcitae]UUX33301.1 NADH-dependent flavin oxidoreductase [Fundicoccus culcitae]